jgi:hypothetical protein
MIKNGFFEVKNSMHLDIKRNHFYKEDETDRRGGRYYKTSYGRNYCCGAVNKAIGHFQALPS